MHHEDLRAKGFCNELKKLCKKYDLSIMISRDGQRLALRCYSPDSDYLLDALSAQPCFNLFEMMDTRSDGAVWELLGMDYEEKDT